MRKFGRALRRRYGRSVVPRWSKLLAGASAIGASGMALPVVGAGTLPLTAATAVTVGSLAGVVLIIDGLIDDESEEGE